MLRGGEAKGQAYLLAISSIKVYPGLIYSETNTQKISQGHYRGTKRVFSQWNLKLKLGTNQDDEARRMRRGKHLEITAATGFTIPHHTDT